EVDRQKQVRGFQEKPQLSGKRPVLASMGNYIFDTELLVEALEEDVQRNTTHDFGRDIIPHLVKKKVKVFAYDFSGNRIPSLKEYEAKFYWKDVGTISSYWEANMDLLGSRPKLNLDNQEWPIYASHLNYPPAYVVHSQMENSLICEGAKISGSQIKNSIIGRAVEIKEGSMVENSIIMDFSRLERACRIKNTIVDRFNTISKSTTVGYNKKVDGKDYYVDPAGIVVVRRGSRKAFYF
ncbi:MAG: glucose-1-phosphate adenylyltransferase, partial [Candidatus Omnitrophota bacterium]